MPRLCVAADTHGGMGIFTGEDIEEGVVVTHYFGPVRFPKTETHSKTHSLRILGDFSVHVDFREVRVIDGSWAQAAVRQFFAQVPDGLAPFVGSMINSSRGVSMAENVTTKARDLDGDPLFKYEELTRSAVADYFSDNHRDDPVLSDEERTWIKLAMVSTRRIRAGDELRWSYPFRR